MTSQTPAKTLSTPCKVSKLTYRWSLRKRMEAAKCNAEICEIQIVQGFSKFNLCKEMWVKG
jgi:hypothetical protein